MSSSSTNICCVCLSCNHYQTAWHLTTKLGTVISQYPAKAGGVSRHIAWYISLYPLSCSVRWMPGWRTGDQRRPMRSG